MVETVIKLKAVITKAVNILNTITEEEATKSETPGKWCPKEIIGHLIDSAANNHQKFIRSMEADGLNITGYQQDSWVEIQNYKSQNWLRLLKFWEQYNSHLASVMALVSERQLKNTLFINGVGPFTLRFVMEDYVVHLEHHLNQLLPDSGFKSNFKTEY